MVSPVRDSKGRRVIVYNMSKEFFVKYVVTCNNKRAMYLRFMFPLYVTKINIRYDLRIATIANLSFSLCFICDYCLH